MKSYTIARVSTYTNAGQRAQQDLDYALTGHMRHADCVPFDMDSDIPELAMSVKSSHFTLVSAARIHADTFDGIWNEYAARVHSQRFAYVCKDMTVYEMNLDEFRLFVYEFCTLQKQSEKCGGRMTIRCRAETKKMLCWLENMVVGA